MSQKKFYRTAIILYNIFAPDGGDMEEFRVIKKEQQNRTLFYTDFYEKAFLSFDAFQKGNDIYFIFNDNLENYTGKKDKTFKNNWKKSCTMLVKMNENGEEERKILLNSKTQQKMFEKLLFVDGNDLIIHASNKKNMEFSRVLFED